MKEEIKDLAYFQQQVVEKYGYKNVSKIIADDPLALDEAAEDYALYRRSEGYVNGYKDGIEVGYENGTEQGKLNGWNEALHWAAENARAGQGMAEHGDHLEPFVYKQSILNGLKK